MTAPTGADWSARYDAGDTPWDLGTAHPELLVRLAADPTLGVAVDEPGTALVPGCGRGHDAHALADAGWSVIAVDLAPSVAAAVTGSSLGPSGRFVIGDALDSGTDLGVETVDLVFDHTLFCALPPERRPGFGAMAERLTSPTGSVISIVFPIGRDHTEGGPPWGMTIEDLDNSLGPGFTSAERAGEIRVRGRSWPHRWCRWDRR